MMLLVVVLLAGEFAAVSSNNGVEYYISNNVHQTCSSTCESQGKVCVNEGHGMPSDSVGSLLLSKCNELHNNLCQFSGYSHYYSDANPARYYYHNNGNYYCRGYKNVPKIIQCNHGLSHRLCPCTRKEHALQVSATVVNQTAINITWTPSTTSNVYYRFHLSYDTHYLKLVTAPDPTSGWLVVGDLLLKTYCVTGWSSVITGYTAPSACAVSVTTQQGDVEYYMSSGGQTCSAACQGRNMVCVTEGHGMPRDSVYDLLLRTTPSLYSYGCNVNYWPTYAYHDPPRYECSSSTCYCMGYKNVPEAIECNFDDKYRLCPCTKKDHPLQVSATVVNQTAIKITWTPSTTSNVQYKFHLSYDTHYLKLVTAPDPTSGWLVVGDLMLKTYCITGWSSVTTGYTAPSACAVSVTTQQGDVEYYMSSDGQTCSAACQGRNMVCVTEGHGMPRDSVYDLLLRTSNTLHSYGCNGDNWPAYAYHDPPRYDCSSTCYCKGYKNVPAAIECNFHDKYRLCPCTKKDRPLQVSATVVNQTAINITWPPSTTSDVQYKFHLSYDTHYLKLVTAPDPTSGWLVVGDLMLKTYCITGWSSVTTGYTAPSACAVSVTTQQGSVEYYMSSDGQTCSAACQGRNMVCVTEGHGMPRDSVYDLLLRTSNTLHSYGCNGFSSTAYSDDYPPSYSCSSYSSTCNCKGYKNVPQAILCNHNYQYRLCPCSKTDHALQVSATVVNQTAINITWTPSTTSDVYYRFHLSFDTHYLKLVTAPDSKSSWLVVEDLSVYKTYCVKGWSTVGTGFTAPTLCVVSVTTLDEVPKVAPLIQNVVASQPLSLQVVWYRIPASSVKGVIQGYIVSYRVCSKSNQEGNISVAGGSSSYSRTLTGLTSSTCYCVQVAGYTRTGIGVYSSCQQGTTFAIAPTQPPQSFTVSANSPTSITAAWELVPLEHAHGAITKYIVRCYDSAQAQTRTVLYTPSQRQGNITGLKPFSFYCCKIAACNAVGLGVFSSCINTTTLVGVPDGPPQSVSGNHINSTSIHVHWQPVQENQRNGPNGWYFIKNYPENNAEKVKTTLVNGNCTMAFNITGLMAFTRYCVQVRMSSRSGNGPWSACTYISTDEGVPTGAPLNIHFQVLSSVRIDIMWDPPAQAETHGHVTKYSVYGASLNPQRKDNFTKSSVERTVFADGLLKFMMYCVQVSASTRIGEGPKSACSNVTTAEDVPSSPPESINITNITSSQAVISWKKIPDNFRHGLIIGYRIIITHNDTLQVNVTVDAVTRTKKVLNLVPFSQFCVQLAGLTQVGEGTKSGCVNMTTLEQAPSTYPPIESATNISSTSLFVKWDTVPHWLVHGIVTGYYIYYTHDGNTRSVVVNVTKTNTTLVGLEKFSMYCIQVAVMNSVGRGPRSPCINVSTGEDVPTGAPLNIHFQVLSSVRIDIMWDPPDQAETHGHVAMYSVYGASLNPQRKDNFTKRSVVRTVFADGLLKFTKYCVQVSASTRIGEGPKSACSNVTTAEDVPSSPPESIKITDITSSQAVISWKTIPENFRHGLIIGYRIIITHNDTLQVNVTVDAVARTKKVLNLVPFSQFCVQLAGLTQVGEGTKSGCVNIATLEQAPSTYPQIMSATNISSTSLFVKWDTVPHLLVHGIATGYYIYYTHDGNTRSVVVNATTTNTTLVGLEKFSLYCIQVAVMNSVGRGPRSPCINVSTGEDVPSRAPSHITAQAVNTTTVEVAWSHIPVSFVHGTLRGHRVKVSRRYGNAKHEDMINIFYPVMQAHVSGLEPFTEYCVIVAAWTRKGMGFRSDCTYVTTLQAAPSASPSNVSAWNTSSTSVHITWQPVDNRRGIILGYHVYLVSNTTAGLPEEHLNQTVNGSTTTADVNELRKFVMYYVSVAAFTVAGVGPRSASVAVRTDGDVPDEPPHHIAGQNLSSTSLEIHVKAPSSDTFNGKPLGYNIRLYRQDQDGNLVAKPYKQLEIYGTTNTSIVLSDLDKGITYCLHVAVFSSYGRSNYSNCIFVKTNEEAPSLPPQNASVKSTSSSTLFIKWERIPWQNCNGVIIAYIIKLFRKEKSLRRRRRSVSSGEVFSVTVLKDSLSYEFTGLDKDTEYCAQVSGVTAAGVGNASSCIYGHTQATDNVIPNITLHGSPGPTSIKVAVLLEKHSLMIDSGFLLNFEIIYKAVSVAGKSIVSKAMTKEFPANMHVIELTDLQTYSTYSVVVAAITRHGISDYSEKIIVETCRCPPLLYSSWYSTPPFAMWKDNSPTGMLPTVLQNIITKACGECGGQRSNLVITTPYSNATQMKEHFDPTMAITFPVIDISGKVQLRGQFVAMIKVPSVLVLSREVSMVAKYAKVVTSSIFQCWPVVLINIVMMILAGIVMWSFENGTNGGQFPRSAFAGIQEGVWWALVTMTTVGYGDRSPVTYSGRVFGIVWSLIGLIMSSMLIAAITSSLAYTVVVEMDSSKVSQGEKIASVLGSPESVIAERLARGRANYTSYKSFKNLVAAFQVHNVTSIVLDPYTVQSRPDIFNGTWYKISKIVDVDVSYGVILGQNAVKLERHFREYVQSNVIKAVTSFKVDEGQNSTEAPSVQVVIESESVNFLDPSSPIFREGLFICGLVLLGVAFVGLAYHVLVYNRLKQGREKSKNTKNKSEQTVQEMRELIEDFYIRFTRVYRETKNAQTQQTRERNSPIPIKSAWGPTGISFSKTSKEMLIRKEVHCSSPDPQRSSAQSKLRAMMCRNEVHCQSTEHKSDCQ